ncbi:MAG TPA: SusC/RagA family TonB-linked outer membrane protein [Puia sp.]|jgi:TonB-linked SusC/RagA family outer membrane protein|nr:SusC/RagA family TonB-linked outer membrane protein [Puia sp.]
MQMKKLAYNEGSSRSFFLCFKLTFVLTTMTLLNASGRALSQSVTISGANMPLREIFSKIENQTGYQFLYKADLLREARLVTLHIKDVAVTDALHQCLDGQALDFYIEDKTVFVMKRSVPPAAAADTTPGRPALREITGKVVDPGGQPVSSASIQLKDSRTGTAADSNGNFSIHVPLNAATLLISHVGFVNREVAIGERTALTITLTPNPVSEQEVVVRVGYGTMAQREVTSAITHVSSKDLLPGANNDPLMAIQGKVSGLTVTNTAAADPNSTTSLQLRGVSSRNAGLGPLYVINGVPGGNIDNINQNDIESIDVLKGGAASAIYGTRGSNGVVLITTKTGSSQSKTLYDVYLADNIVTDQLKVLSPGEFLAHNRGTDAGARTNWLRALTRRPDLTQKHTLQFSGGSARDNYLATIDYRNANGLDLRAGKQEYGARLNFNHTSSNNFFSANLTVAPRVMKTNVADNSSFNVFNWGLTLNPTLPIYDSLGNYKYINGGLFAGNPVEKLKLEQSQQQIKELDMSGTFKVNILPNLNTVLTIGEVYQSLKALYFSPSTLSTTMLINGGNGRNDAKQDMGENTQLSLEWTGNYSLFIGKHSLKLLAGYSYQHFSYQDFNAENQNIPFDALSWNNLGSGIYDQQPGVSGVGSSQNSSALAAFFGRVTYDFDKKYFLTASLRREGSTKFGTDNKWGNFPALSAGWLLSEEKFMQSTSRWLNMLKIRGDYGVTGNQDFPSYQSLLTYGGYGFYPYNGTYYQDFGPSQNVNPFLRWEKAINFNWGIDFGLLDNRISGSINYYTRKNQDLLGNYNVPVPPNLQTTTYVNVGTMKNSGIEIQVNAGIVRSRDFSYDLMLAGNTNDNKLVSFSNQLYNGGTFQDGVSMPAPGSPGNLQRLQEGVRVGSFYTLHAAGVDSSGGLQVYNQKGQIISATQANNDDRRFVGNGLPKFMASMGNNFRYKQWDLSIFLRGSFDYKIFNTYAFYIGTPAQQANVNLLTSAYDGSKYSKLTNPKTVAILSDYFLEPGSFVKVDNVTLGYTRHFSSKYLHSARVYATGRNLHTFTKYKGGDPDLIPLNGLWPGVNNSLNYYPSALQLVFGLQVQF